MFKVVLNVSIWFSSASDGEESHSSCCPGNHEGGAWKQGQR